MELVLIGFLLCVLGLIVVLFIRMAIKTETQINNLNHKLNRITQEQIELREEIQNNQKIDEVANKILANINRKLQ